MKRKYANVGEKVRIINTLQFVRCGYPLCSGEIDKRDDLRKRKWELVNRAIGAMFPDRTKLTFGVSLPGDWLQRDDDTLHYECDRRVSSKIEAAANMAILIEEGFGGKERRVFEEPIEMWDHTPEKEYEVTKKRFVKTGDRFPASGRWTYFGDYEDQPGGLSNEYTHCVYQLDGWLETLAKNTERIEGGRVK